MGLDSHGASGRALIPMTDSTSMHYETQVEQVLSRFEGVHQIKPNEWMAYDPTYDDGSKHRRRGGPRGGQSLHITQTPEKILLHSFARGREATPEILERVNLTERDLFLDRGDPASFTRASRLVATYVYHDRTGASRYEIRRYEPKSFRQFRYDEQGQPVPGVQGVERLLYRLPELYEESKRWVAFAEGEKCADCLADLGMLSTCIAGGTNGPIPPTMVDDLRSHAGVCIFPDNDAPGEAFAQKIARILHDGGIRVKVVRL